jgi:AcrR family transcriptional regulator
VSIATRMTSEERRAVIVEAAVRLFSERGFRGTTTRALAEAVGVTEPVLYEHFKSKRELYAAIVEAKSREGMARAEAWLQPLADAKDDRAVFIGVGRVILESFSEDRAYVRLLLSAALEDPELGAIFYERQREGREKLAGYIAERIRDGAFRPVDPAIAALAFIGMLYYHGLVGLLYCDDFIKVSPEEAVEQMVGLFLRGISSSVNAQ